jgi:hypothetical protein
MEISANTFDDVREPVDALDEGSLGDAFPNRTVGELPLDLATYWICVGLEDW